MPLAVVTVMFTLPTAPAGAVAVICMADLTVKLLAVLVPNITAVAPVKVVPVMVTTVPAFRGPAVGLMDVTTGPT